MATFDDIENQKTLNEKLREGIGLTRDSLEFQQNISNDLQRQVSYLRDNVTEKKQIRSITREINKITYETYNLNIRDLGTQKNITKLASDKIKIGNSLNQLEAQRNIFANRRGVINRRITEALDDQIDQLQKTLGVLSKAQRASQEIRNNLGVKTFDGLASVIGDIPGLRKLSQPFQEAADAARATVVAGKPTKALFAGFDTLGRSLLGTAAVLGGLFSILGTVDRDSGKLAENLGISYTEALDLTVALNDAVLSSNNVFLNTENLVDAQIELSQILGTNAALNADMLETQIELTKMAGYSVEAAGQLAQLSAATGITTEDIATNFLGQVRALNLTNNLAVNEKALLESIAKTSKGTLATFADNPKYLAKAAFEARRLGLELSQVEQIAESLLDIESSLTAEFEAEVISGRQLNLERARYYALTNDLAGVTKELTAQGITQEKFARSSRIEQDAIAQAMGMSRDELGNMLIEQKALAAIGVRDADAAKAKFELLRAQYGEAEAIQRLGDETYAQQLAAVSLQERFSEVTNKLKDAFVSLVGPILQGLAPALELVSSIVAGIGNTVQFLSSSFAGIPGILVGMIPLLSKAAFIARAFAARSFAGAIAAIYRSFAAVPFGLGLPLAIAAVGGLGTLIKSTRQSVQDGIAPSSKGPFTITDSYGATAITARGDSLAVSPNVTRDSRNSGTMLDYDKLAEAIAKGAERGTSRATVATYLDGDRVSTRIQPSLAVNTRRYSV